MFVLRDDGGERVLVNEIAPRVHNSGHWTIDGAATSQFEQHIRAVAGWPLGSPRRLGRVEMTNLIGDEVDGLAEHRSPSPAPRCTSTARASARPGRKMGHVDAHRRPNDAPEPGRMPRLSPWTRGHRR